MFVDHVKVSVKAGNGGNGAITFHREKYVDSGGPDGGDGGRGGSVCFKVDKGMNTLLNFRYTKNIVAKDGENGKGGNCTGKSAEDIVVLVPMGTVISDAKNGKVIADLSKDDSFYVVCKGGKGGKGNQHFANSIRQAPRFAEIGEQGEEKELDLELKLIADVGLIGFPNVGKSTIISTVSSAKPKIANYHFTTLEPSLGVVKAKSGATFVMADIPGIIEGASEGVGLGIKFLRHVERTRILLHVIDISGSEDRDPIEDYIVINKELKNFSEKLASKKQIIVANKVDLLQDESVLKELKEICKSEGREVVAVSAATNNNLDELVEIVAKYLEEMPREEIEDTDSKEYLISLDEEDVQMFKIDKIKNEFFVTGQAIERLMRRVNVNDLESRQYMQRSLRSIGVTAELKKMGIKDEDTVDILGFKFEYEE